MRGLAILGWGLLLAGCGSEPAKEQPSAPAAREAEAGQPKAAAEPKKLGCPFTETSGWYAQIESDTFSVDGRVDLMMAGYAPVLRKRASQEAGTIALDLSLEPAPGGAVNAAAHYEEPLGQPYRRVAIYCADKQVASFEPLDQRLD